MLRPCLSATVISDKSKLSQANPMDLAKQETADSFWRWAETRIVEQTDIMCEHSVREIVEAVTDRRDCGSRMQLILTQSAVTLDAVSPFDKLSATLATRRSLFPVRISGSACPTIDSVQQAIVQTVLGVTSSIVFADSSATGISLKGLDASIVEELGIGQDLVVIVEEADAVGRDLLFDIIKLVYFLQKKTPSRIDLILNTDLGEPWIEEVVCDERIFADLHVRKIPLIDARDLNRRIRSVFFGSGCDSKLQGFPISLGEDDHEFLSRDLPGFSLSPMELCCHILLMVTNWFKRCDLSFITEPLKAEQDVKKLGLKLPPQLSKKGVLGENMRNLIEGRKRVAVLSRIVSNLAKAIRGSDDGSLSRLEGMLKTGECSLINQCVLELQSKWRSGRKFKEVGLDVECLNGRLIDELVSRFDFPIDDPCLTGVREFTGQTMELAQRNYGITEAIEKFYKLINTYIETELTEVKNLKVAPELLIGFSEVASLQRPESLMIHVGYFDPTVAFLREDPRRVEKSAIAEDGLKKMHAVGRIVFGKQVAVASVGKKGSKKARTGKENQNTDNDSKPCADPKKVSATYCDFDYLTQFVKKEDDMLAESLASLEFLGLLRPPGFFDLSGLAGCTESRIRKLYRDTYLVDEEAGNDDEEVLA